MKNEYETNAGRFSRDRKDEVEIAKYHYYLMALEEVEAKGRARYKQMLLSMEGTLKMAVLNADSMLS